MIDKFDSYRQYAGFTFAREFFHRDTKQVYLYPKNILEKVGGALTFVVLKPADLLILKIRSPLVVLSSVIVGIALTTILFYPTQSIAMAMYLFPPLVKTGPKLLRMGTFLLLQSTILGLGIRTLGRLSNPELMNMWDRRGNDNLRLLTSMQLGS